MQTARKMRSLPIGSVRLTGGPLKDRQDALIERGLGAQFRQIVETGRLDNFRRAARGEAGGHRGKYFDDSDVYKWIEACAYAVALRPDAAIRAQMEEAVEAVAAAQMPDGYLNTFFQLEHPGLRWRNLAAMHELYCAGHLIEAGVAHFEASGERALLDVAVRLADHIASVFGPGKKPGFCGHEEAELALMRLSDVIPERRDYRELGEWMVRQRGRRPSPLEASFADEEAMALSPWMRGMVFRDGEYSGEYFQDHAPVEEQSEVVGHAVRAMYFFASAAEIVDDTMFAALERLWDGLTGRRMYVTGGIGPSEHNEGFTADYDLPNRTAYAETCAAVGLIFWARRMLERTGDSKYADVLETALFNGALSGVSLDGTLYFYTNPLESRGEHSRVPWFPCACCPPNVARMLLSASDCLISTGEDSGGLSALWLHVPCGMDAKVRLGGVPAEVRIESNYPWDGRFAVEIRPERAVEACLKVRVPAWSDGFGATLPSHISEDEDIEKGYVAFRGEWRPGDRIEFDLPMEPRWVESHPLVLENVGRAALTRGPLVYCLEEADFGQPPQRFAADVESSPRVRYDAALSGGICAITVPGNVESSSETGALYRQAANAERQRTEARFVPYYSWCNRGPGGMQVWVRRSAK